MKLYMFVETLSAIVAFCSFTLLGLKACFEIPFLSSIDGNNLFMFFFLAGILNLLVGKLKQQLQEQIDIYKGRAEEDEKFWKTYKKKFGG